MKIKRTSLVALIVAVALVVGVTTAFATSAKTDKNMLHRDSDYVTDTVMEGADILSYVAPQDGKTYYSFDGGQTFEPLTDEEFEQRFPTSNIEWWTYDEYKAWLENEKVELQDMIGEWGWTGGRGEFVWTQEIVDETIAMYEGILEDFKNGMLYSKTIDGEDAFCSLSSGSADVEAEIYEGDAIASDFSPYEPYGLTWDEGEKALFWNGQRVQNADGSFDPMSPLTGLEKYSQAEFGARTLHTASQTAETYTYQEIAIESKKMENC